MLFQTTFGLATQNLPAPRRSDIKPAVRLVPFPSFLGNFLRYALSCGLIVWLGTTVDWTQFTQAREVDWALTGAAVLLAGLAYPLQAWRWQLLLRAQGLNSPARWIHQVFWSAQFYNSFLPGGIAGDAIRISFLWRVAPDRKAAGAASLLADRLLGFVLLCVLATLALALYLNQRDGRGELHTMLGISSAIVVGLLVLAWSVLRTRCWEILTTRLLGEARARPLHDAALILGSNLSCLAQASALSMLSWLTDFAAAWLLARSVGVAASPLVITVAVAIAYIAATLPLSIGGHGLREGALVVVLGWLGLNSINQPALPLFAAAFLAVSIGWSLFGGLVHLLASPVGRPTAENQPARSTERTMD